MKNNEHNSENSHKKSNLLVCGINHHSASLAEREKFQLNRQEIPKALKTFLSFDGIVEVALLSTCNRFEMYFCTKQKSLSNHNFKMYKIRVNLIISLQE